VLLVHGACSTEGPGCREAVSGQEFEDVLRYLSPGGKEAPGMKRQLAKTYADLLAMDGAARALGMDASPEYQNTLRWLEAKTLADLLRRRLENESRQVSEAEIDASYQKRLAQFEVVTLRRLALPKDNFAAEDRQKFEQEVQRVAGELRDRAVGGDDFDVLQKQGYEAIGFRGVPPATQAGNRRRADLPPEVSGEIFSLRPGEVSKIENETYSFVLYKVEARWTLPKEQVREEIARDISKEKLEQALKSVTANIRTELNAEYFGTAAAQ
jgi:PPIC-type PPIASE domain